MIPRLYNHLFAACLTVAMLTFSASCNPDEEVADNPSGSGNSATLTTLPVSNISGASATSGGNIINDGGSAITQRGIVWSTTPNPTTASSSTNDGSGAGSFTSSLNGLIANTTYYVRSYAMNGAGTAYGNQVSFTSAQGAEDIVSNPGEGVTFNGHQYPSIVLGNGQEWMAENLRTSLYANGDPIPNVLDGSQWLSLITGAWVYNENDSQYDNPYGKLYNWYAVNDSRNVCPIGWHVPSDLEWTSLIDYCGGDSIAGGKLKMVGLEHWIAPNSAATNEIGFQGLPSGGRSFNPPTFTGIGVDGPLWSSDESSNTNAWTRNLMCTNGYVNRHGTPKYFGLAVRCVRD
jgi:uncharacterized protein (TIGR02145 family)